MTASDGGSKKRYDGPRYQRVSETFWNVTKLRGWSDDAIIMFLYILTSKHRTLEGFYLLPIAYIAADLGWSVRRAQKTLIILINSDVIGYDITTDVVIIKNALKYQTPDSSNVVTGLIARVKRLPNTILLKDFIELAKRHCQRESASRSAQSLPQQLEREFKHLFEHSLEQVSELLNPKSEIRYLKSEIGTDDDEKEKSVCTGDEGIGSGTDAPMSHIAEQIRMPCDPATREIFERNILEAEEQT